jgi:uncharacterized membrane protein YraQ (UPF0718 family)
MNTVFTLCLYGVTAVLLIVSLCKDKKKTRLALKKAWKICIGVLPQFGAILLLMGMMLSVTPPESVEHIMGRESGVMGLLAPALLGSAAAVPVLVAFPIAAQLLQNGAGVMPVAVFISTLTTVGFVTMPLEMKYLGKKAAWLRNLLALVFSFAVAMAVEAVLG